MHSSCMHENACKCANLLACLMHVACMPACMIHACSAGMHSLEGLPHIHLTSLPSYINRNNPYQCSVCSFP